MPVSASWEWLESTLPPMEGAVYHCSVLCAVVAVVCFFVAEITGNHGQTDKLWSLLPFMYSLIFLWADSGNNRLWLMILVSGVWSVRLTWNFNRRGGYSWPPWQGEE